MFYSLRSRLILFFVLLFVLSFGALSLLIFNESRTIIRSYIESSALEKMNEYGSYIDMVQTQIYDLASLVFNSDQSDTWDSIASDTSTTEGEKMLAHIQMSKFLTQTTNSYTSISSVALYRREGVWVSMDNQVIKESSFLDQAWYKQFRDETVRWVPAHTDDVELKIRRSDHPVVSMLMPIGAFEPKQAKTVLKVNVSADYFLEPLSRIHLGESGTMYLIDQHGSPLLTQADYETNASLAKNEVARAQAGRGKQGVVYFRNSQGDAQILVYKKLAQNGWMLVGIVPESDLYAPLLKLRNSIIVLAAALLLISLFVAFWLSNGITRPLSRLVSAMRHVQRGDFDSAESRLPLEGTVRNEVGFATATFRNMIGRLRQHIKNEFELKLLRQQAEYKALLMQINPHFLFNTLELLSSLAMQRRTDDTVKVIESLGKMLRFGLRISDDLVALKEELKYVHDYASILRIRFGDRLWLSMEEDGLPEHAACVKFVLQPLLENAVKYSFAHRTEARVSVRVYRRDSHVIMSVTDNGPGMTEKQIREVLHEAASARPDQILASRERQIGLGNVLARCRLYYGLLFEAHLDSKPGGGTRIELMLPIREVNNDVSLIDRG